MWRMESKSPPLTNERPEPMRGALEAEVEKKGNWETTYKQRPVEFSN